MHYNTELNNHGLKADPFKACVGPRPIAWISTVSADGVDNLAPFSQFNNLSYNPPMVMVAFQPGGSEEEAFRKDTLNNIELRLQHGALRSEGPDEHHRHPQARP